MFIIYYPLFCVPTYLFLHLWRDSRSVMSNMKQKDIRPAPAEIEFKGFKFLITDRPTDLTIPNYILVSWYSRDTPECVKRYLEVVDFTFLRHLKYFHYSYN